jgi:hypothetical protein
MNDKDKHILKLLFLYTKSLGKCQFEVMMFDDKIGYIDDTIKTFDDNGNFTGRYPMREMFFNLIRNIVNFYLYDIGKKLDESKVEDKSEHNLVFEINPTEKKITIVGYGNIPTEEYIDYMFKPNEKLVIDLIENNINQFEMDFWGGWGSREIEFNSITGDDNAYPGLIRGHSRYFYDLMDENVFGWDSEEGSSGTILVNKKQIKISCTFKESKMGKTGFKKTLTLND